MGLRPTDQVTYWSTDAGPKWVRLQDRLDAQLSALGAAAMDALGITRNERVLDVGCGCGATTLELAARVGAAGHVTGIDLSPPMLARARERMQAAGLDNVTFIEADAQTVALAGPPRHAAFSRFGLMFFDDPQAAFGNLRRLVVPGGRIGFVCWQAMGANEWARVGLAAVAEHVPLPDPPPPDAPGPFSLADPDRIHRLLTNAGWVAASITPHVTRLAMGGSSDPEEAADLLMEIGPAARVLRTSAPDPDLAARIRASLLGRLRAHAGPSGLLLEGATWIVTARAPA